MNPYKVDYRKFKGSKKITDQRDLLKLRLMVQLEEVMGGNARNSKCSRAR